MMNGWWWREGGRKRREEGGGEGGLLEAVTSRGRACSRRADVTGAPEHRGEAAVSQSVTEQRGRHTGEKRERDTEQTERQLRSTGADRQAGCPGESASPRLTVWSRYAASRQQNHRRAEDSEPLPPSFLTELIPLERTHSRSEYRNFLCVCEREHTWFITWAYVCVCVCLSVCVEPMYVCVCVELLSTYMSVQQERGHICTLSCGLRSVREGGLSDVCPSHTCHHQIRCVFVFLNTTDAT